MRESWRPEVRRGGVLTAAQFVGPAEQGVARRGLALGVMDAQGVWRCQFKGRSMDLGERARCKHGGNHGRGSRAVDGARGNRISA